MMTNKVLAYFLDLMKAKSPSVAVILMLVLGTANYFFTHSGELLGENWDQVGYFVTLFFGMLTGSRTTSYLDE